MWKLIAGFVVFAALALFMMKKMGADVDMSGEKHGVETSSHAAEPASAASAAPALPASAAASK